MSGSDDESGRPKEGASAAGGRSGRPKLDSDDEALSCRGAALW